MYERENMRYTKREKERKQERERAREREKLINS